MKSLLSDCCIYDGVHENAGVSAQRKSGMATCEPDRSLNPLLRSYGSELVDHNIGICSSQGLHSGFQLVSMHLTCSGGSSCHSILDLRSCSGEVRFEVYPLRAFRGLLRSLVYSRLTEGTTAILPYPKCHKSLQNSVGSPWKHSSGPLLLKEISRLRMGSAVKATPPFQQLKTWNGR